MINDRRPASRTPWLRQVWPPVRTEAESRLNCQNARKLRQVQSVLRWRAMRAKVLSSTLFSDPAWEALLQVYASELGDCPPTLMQLASALQSPPAVAGTWVRALEEEGLVRWQEASEAAPLTIRLTDSGMGGMHALFELWPDRGSAATLSA